MMWEQQGNKNSLTDYVSVYTNTPCMGRPPKTASERRSKLFPLRLTPGELAELESASRSLGESVAAIFREGAKLYMTRGKDGPRPRRKERKT